MASPETIQDTHSFLNDTCKSLDIGDELKSILIAPSREIRVELPLKRDDGSYSHFSGYRVQHHNALGPYKGGLRFHPDVTLEESRQLACLMSLKTALAGLPLGGAKGGIDCDPHDLSRDELQRLTRYFVRKMHHNMGPNTDIPAPDIGTNAQVMAWIQDEYSVLYGFSPAAVTGKPVLIGGSQGRESATGDGVGIVMNEYAIHRAEILDGGTAVIQGFGNVGLHTALDLARRGMKILAISDSRGAVHDSEGLDIGKLVAHKAATGAVTGFANSDTISDNELLGIECDYLIPAALGNTITAKNAKSLRARVVAEAANNPISYEADPILTEQGIVVLPDILVNSGGVIVSYYEWVQNLQQMPWPASRVSEELTKTLQASCNQVFAIETGKHCGFRAAAYEVAVERLRDAICMTIF